MSWLFTLTGILDVFLQLIRIAPGDTASLARLNGEIGQTQAVAEKRWLMGLMGGEIRVFILRA
jgi:hypothetical protein